MPCWWQRTPEAPCKTQSGQRWQMSFSVDTCKLIHLMKNNLNHIHAMLTNDSEKKSRSHHWQIPGINSFMFKSNQKNIAKHQASWGRALRTRQSTFIQPWSTHISSTVRSSDLCISRTDSSQRRANKILKGWSACLRKRLKRLFSWREGGSKIRSIKL